MRSNFGPMFCDADNCAMATLRGRNVALGYFWQVEGLNGRTGKDDGTGRTLCPDHTRGERL